MILHPSSSESFMVAHFLLGKRAANALEVIVGTVN